MSADLLSSYKLIWPDVLFMRPIEPGNVIGTKGRKANKIDVDPDIRVRTV